MAVPLKNLDRLGDPTERHPPPGKQPAPDLDGV